MNSLAAALAFALWAIPAGNAALTFTAERLDLPVAVRADAPTERDCNPPPALRP